MINQLAEQLGVTTKDLNSLLTIVSSSLEQDGMVQYFIRCTEQERLDITQAYIRAEVDKFKKFCEGILVSQDKKDCISLYVFERLKRS